MPDSTQPVGGFGQFDTTDLGSDFQIMMFMIRQAIARIATMMPVTVKAVYDAEGNAITADDTGVIGPCGFVDVQPMVNEVDGNNNNQPSGTIFNIPYCRLQGGDNGVILDPQVGDPGWLGCAERDISVIKKTAAVGPPGSNRQFSTADGVFIMGMLSGTPKQYLRFKAKGIDLLDRNGNFLTTSEEGMTLSDCFGHFISMASEGITIDAANAGGDVTINGNKVRTHAEMENAWDVNGMGFVYQSFISGYFIVNYTLGVASEDDAPSPPEVPF